jgi:hypothetical protein
LIFQVTDWENKYQLIVLEVTLEAIGAGGAE